MSKEKLDWNSVQFEADMEKEISHRKILGSLTTGKHFSEVRIADQFFLFGIPPNTKKQGQTSILVAFPSFQQPSIPIANVLKFAYPNPETSNSNGKFKFSLSDSSANESGVVDEFVFQFKARSTVMYGSCVHIQPSKANKTSSNPFYSSDNTKKSKFCFCLISRIPIFNVHFTFLHYLLSISNSSKKQKTNATATTNVNLFEGLEVNGLFGQYPQLQIPEEFRIAITDHFAKTVFSPPVKLPPNFIIHFPPPTAPIQNLILCASLDNLFSVLSVPDIVELLTALILDAQVLVIGTSMHEVSMTVYGLYALLTPFNYCGTVMPILPIDDDYLNLLNSPTPYIYGMQNIAKLRNMSFLESTYIVNLDKHKKTASNFYPKYPNFKTVVQKITDILMAKKVKIEKKSSDSIEMSKNRKEKCKSTTVDTKDIKLSKTTSSTVIKPPPLAQNENPYKVQFNVNNDNDGNVDDDPNEKIMKSRRMRSLTVTKKDYQTEIGQQQQQQNTGQLADIQSSDKQISFPEIANDNNPFSFPTDFTKKLNHKVSLSMEQIDRILEALHEPLNLIFTDTLNGYFVTDALENITIFNQSLFVASVKQEDQSFYEFLLESQTFQDYVEIKLGEFSAAKNTDPSKSVSVFERRGGRRRRASTVKKVIKVFD